MSTTPTQIMPMRAAAVDHAPTPVVRGLSESASEGPDGAAAVRALLHTGAVGWMFKCIVAPAKFLALVLLCQVPILVLLAVGWTYRLMQRSTVKYWHRRSGVRAAGIGFRDFALGHERLAPLAHWPNLVLEQNAVAAFRRATGEHSANRGLGMLLRLPVHSLWLNAKIGFLAAFNTAVVTLPLLGLLGFAWWGGWNNSFNKGYEQAWVGPTSGVVAITALGVVMMFVPMAQARQASAGTWRAFFDLRLIRGLVRRHWITNLLLWLAYAAAGVPIMAMSMAPTFMGDAQDWQSVDQVVQFLNQYYLLITLLYVLPAWLTLRWLASKVYARAVLHDLRRGRIDVDDLAEPECFALHKLGLIELGRLHPVPDPGPTVTRGLSAAARLKWAAVFWSILGLLSIATWWIFFSQPVVAQFFNYRMSPGWTNHPLIHVPIVRDVPPTQTIQQALEVRKGM